MLKTRIITALLLFVFFVSALFFSSPAVWVVLATAVAALAAWEWGALQAFGARSRVALAVAVLLFAALIASLHPEALGLGSGFSYQAGWGLGRWFYVPVTIFWVLVVPVWMRTRWSLPRSLGGSLIGMLLILPTWLALIQLRQLGPWALIGLMAVVWVADTGAYFFGRRFGRTKLAPNISPGKTWEGAIGGTVLVVIYGLVIGFGFSLVSSSGIASLTFGMLAFAALSIIGDLFESLLKRQAGLKDSSAILPGHGGILDRIDSLTSTLPIASLIWLLQWL